MISSNFSRSTKPIITTGIILIILVLGFVGFNLDFFEKDKQLSALGDGLQSEGYYYQNIDDKMMAYNPASRLNFQIEKGSFGISPRKRSYEIIANFNLEEITVNDKKLKKDKNPQYSTEGVRLTEKHGDAFDINYTNNFKGLRQDFVIHDGPSKDVVIKIDLALETELSPYQIDQYSIGVMDTKKGVNNFKYKDLLVFDADGKFLDAEMTLEKVDEDRYIVGLVAMADDITYPVTIDPLATSDDDYESLQDSTYTGYSLTGTCDLNNDGFVDAVVSSYGAPKPIMDGLNIVNYYFFGKIEVFYGSASGVDLMGGPDFVASGDTLPINYEGFELLGSPPKFGFSVDCAGDVDGDGVDDLIVGAPATTLIDTTGGGSDTLNSVGAFYVFYGTQSTMMSPEGLSMDKVDTVYGTKEFMLLGYSVAGAGNLDGDSNDDFLVSGPGYDSNGAMDQDTAGGIVYVYKGLSAPASPNFEGIDTLEGDNNQRYGTAISGVGDVNGDSFDDFMVGAHTYINGLDTAAGRAHLFLGNNNITPNYSQPGVSYVPNPDWEEFGAHPNAQFGYSLSGAGNFNGIPGNDFLVGANQHNTVAVQGDTTYGSGSGQGAVFVYSGNTTMSPTFTTPDPILLKNDVGASRFGSSVAGIGDVDGNGRVDILVGAPSYNGKSVNGINTLNNIGAVYAYYGENLDSPIDSTYDWCAFGQNDNSFLGAAVDRLGIPGSSSMSIIVGAYGHDSTNTIMPLDEVINNADTTTYLVNARYRGGAFIYNGIAGCGLVKYEKPVFLTFPEDTIFVVAPNGSCEAEVFFDIPTVGYNCDSTLTLPSMPGDLFPIGDSTVTITFTDSQGGSIDSSFVVSVIDNENPVKTDPNFPNLIVIEISGQDTLVEYTRPEFTDCSNMTINPIQGFDSGDSIKSFGVYPIVWEAVDEYGNTTYCSFRIVIAPASGEDGRVCITKFIEDQKDTLKSTVVPPSIVFERQLSEYWTSNGGGGNPGYGLLMSLFEGFTGIRLPGWAKAAIGQIGGIDLAFVKIEFAFLPSIDVKFGIFVDYELPENGAATTLDFIGTICTFKPADQYFGCRDTINMSTSLIVEDESNLEVDPPFIPGKMGISISDFEFQWQIGIRIKACIGVPLCVPFNCNGCLGKRVDSKSRFFVDIIKKRTYFTDLPGGTEDPIKIPIIYLCEKLFDPDADILTVLECATGIDPGIDPIFIDAVKAILDEFGIGDPFSYDEQDDAFVFDPTSIPGIGDKLPEMDLKFGRLTVDEMRPSSVNDCSIVQSGRENNLINARLDIFSLLAYAIPENAKMALCNFGLDITPTSIDIGAPSVDTAGMCSVMPLISVDVLDLNVSLNSRWNADYEYKPVIAIDTLDFNYDLSWMRPNAGPGQSMMDSSQYIENIRMDETFQVVIPDWFPETIPDTFSPFLFDLNFQAEGIYKERGRRSDGLNFDIEILKLLESDLIPTEIGPLFSFFVGRIPLPSPPPLNYADTTTLIVSDINISLQPDTIPPTISCFDTTVYMNEAGLAFLDIESVFDVANSFDEPEGGTGILVPIDVYPDTIFCYQWPETPGYLVVEDDNCNLDTCQFTVFLRDTFPPQIGCKEIEIAIGEDGTYTIQPDEIVIGAVDNCMEINTVVTPNFFTCEDVGDTIEVRVVITDVAGNTNFCLTHVRVIDPMPLLFDLCQQEDIVENAEVGECSAYVNFVVPDIIPNIEFNNLSPTNPETGLPYMTGDRFPLGTTIMTFQAIDFCGNEQICSFNIIVNNRSDAPLLMNCPSNIDPVENDIWVCGGTYDVPAPTFSGTCEDNLMLIYSIKQETDVLETGFSVPGEFVYPLGFSTVTFRVQDQPLLLITEITQDVDTICGGADPSYIIPDTLVGDDYIEITNFGPSTYDVSCLVIERSFGSILSPTIETFKVPESMGAVLEPGEVLVLAYIENTHMDENPDDNYFYKENAINRNADDVVTYRLYYGNKVDNITFDNLIDAVTVPSSAAGGIIRRHVFDTDTPSDFVLADQCMPISIGVYNDVFPDPVQNIPFTSTSLQTVQVQKTECSLYVTVEDTEDPFCGEIVAINNYSNIEGIIVDPVECNDLVINIASEESCIMDTVILRLGGLGATNDEVTLSLTSPEGTEVNIPTGSAVDSIILPNFYSEKSGGDWTLLVTTDKETFTSLSLGDFELEIQCLDTFVMDNVTRFTAEGSCDTSFTWIHPYYLDNCGLGNISVDYSHPNEGEVNLPADGVLTGKGGYEIEALFPIGTTTVTYTLVDEAGNDHMCSFDVTVIDNENPEITFCPSELEPIVIDLAGGECTAAYDYFPTAIDNCGVDTIYGIPASGSEFRIGITEVTVYAVDFEGNVDSSCTFTVTVNEYVPQSDDMACNEMINLSLGGNCEAVLTADMILQGNDYRCFENYCMELFDEKDNLIFSGLLSETQHTFTEADQNKTFKVSIIDCLSGEENFNSCWGYVLVQEKLVPELLCPEPKTVMCNESIHPDQTGPAVLSSCEKDATITWWDDFSAFKECADVSGTIARTWKVRDDEGNVSECTQIITILRGELERIDWPENVSYDNPLVCTSDPANITPEFLSNTLGEEYAIPTINGLPINQNSLCNLFVNYSDEILYGGCEGDYNIHRTWKIENGCLPLSNVAPYNPETKVQRISVRDNIKPIVEDCPGNLTISTDPWVCAATIELPLPKKIEDACSSVSVRAKIYNGGKLVVTGSIAEGNLSIKAIDVPVGEHLVRYDFLDKCNNRNRCEYYLTVVDDVKPFAIAKEFTVASIVESDEDGNQIVKVNAESIDNGSWDGCSELEYFVRRMDGDPHDCDTKDYYPEISSTATDSEKQTAIDEAFDVVECRTVDLADLIALRGDIATREHVQAKYDYGSTICNKGEIPYNGDEWGEYVKFCCDDFGSGEDADGDGYANEFRVELIVFDHYGNWNITWGWVKIEDPNPPVIAVADVSTYCHADYELLDYATLGEAKAYNACEEIPFEKDGPYWMTGTSSDPHPSNFDGYEGRSFEDFNYSCGYGYGWMKYTATNSKGISTDKFQLITVIYKDDFSCDNVNWPIDSITTSCLPLAPDTLTWDAGACALIGYTMETDTFDLGAEGCKKIINNYSVINWCVYDEFNAFGTDDHSSGHFDSQFNELWDHSDEAIDDQFCFDIDREEPHVTGVYKYQQVIKIIDETVPEIQECADVYVDVYDNECDFEFILRNSAIDEGCDEHNFRWLLELYDGEDLYLSKEDNGPDIDFNINYNLDGDIEKTLSAKWKVWDGCGNVDICIYDVILRDKKAPTPYLLNLSSALMEDPDPTDDVLEAMVEIWAADFDVDSKDCSDTLFFTFDNVAFGLGDEDPFEYKEVPHYFDEEGFIETYEDATQDIIDAYLAGDIYLWRPKYWPTMDNMHYTAGKVFTCSDLGEKNVIVTVWDKGLNNDFGKVRLTLRSDDCMDVTPMARVAGIIYTADDRKVSNVSVNIQSLNNVVSAKSMTTSEDGAYAFSNNPMYLDYYVVARKEGDDDQGVSTLDLILIKRHILGLQMLDDPYLRIAADINYDKKITATDLVQLRKLILGIYSKFPQNESWRFIDGDQELFPETALSEYRERRNIVDLSANQMTEDLLAVKIGDINGDARVNARENSLSTRTLKSLVLSYEDHYVQKGETVNVVFAGKGQAEVYGMQFTLSLSGLKVENVEGIGFELSEANYSLSGNKIAVSINKDEKTSFDDELFEMAFVSGKSGSISEMISIDGSITRNEVYVGSDLEVYTLELGKEDDVVAFDLYQNEPNPFTNFTRIGFNLGKSGEATIIIHDVTGKVIKTIVNNYKKGYNEVRLDKRELNVSGLLYYTLSSGTFTATRKMIII